MSKYIGIDPGKTGALAIAYFKDGKIYVSLFAFSSTGEAGTLREVFSINANKQAKIVVENVHSFRGQGVASMFSFGKSFGKILGCLEYLSLPYSLVHPQTWQRPFNMLVSKSLYTKERAKKILSMILNEELELTDGEVDASLIAISAFIKDNPDKINQYFPNLNIIKYDENENLETSNLERILGCN